MPGGALLLNSSDSSLFNIDKKYILLINYIILYILNILNLPIMLKIRTLNIKSDDDNQLYKFAEGCCTYNNFIDGTDPINNFYNMLINILFIDIDFTKKNAIKNYFKHNSTNSNFFDKESKFIDNKTYLLLKTRHCTEHEEIETLEV
jgi:hypothetical protein